MKTILKQLPTNQIRPKHQAAPRFGERAFRAPHSATAAPRRLVSKVVPGGRGQLPGQPAAPAREARGRDGGVSSAAASSPASDHPPRRLIRRLRRVTPARSRPGPRPGAGRAARSHVPLPSGGRRGRRTPKPTPAPRQRVRHRHGCRRAPQIRGLRGVRESAGCLLQNEGEAKKIGVVGWVMNTSKGTVTGQVQGPEEKVNSMKSWLSKVGSPSSRIDRADFSNEKTISQLDYSNFSIRY